ncbi:hypothetical protein Syun_014276 [Stephania yunnanensis]|uniref:cysteine--tRNA ligase n=1 Tax=Stephania yunnanensis TaxID=152371 RepID=A0AAP0JJ14_9MAGN
MEKAKLWVYNTMSKQKELFEAKEAGKVGMYVCGVTAYDLSHIGHARAYVAFDLLYRYLVHLGYEVKYVRNFTDVDDKIIRRANELGEDPLELSNRFCQEFLNDMDDLQCCRPTHQPRVSEHMDQIRDMIMQVRLKVRCTHLSWECLSEGFERDSMGHDMARRLTVPHRMLELSVLLTIGFSWQIIKNECAYPVDGDVYFSVDKFPAYGQLSGRKLEDNRAGERIAIDSRKRNPADFALWKAVKPGEPSWDSPWGPGRPGWHIECSAMSAHYLSPSFDIHGGGMDLIFPHHENEYAQSGAACSECNITYWMHNGFVTENNEKMSKSLGNFFTIRDITSRYDPLALRYFLMSTHYRSPVNYSISQLEIASDSIYYIYQTLYDCEEGLNLLKDRFLKEESNPKAEKITSEAQDCIKKMRSDFQIKMSDDLHTPEILNGTLQETFRLMNKSLESLKKKKQQQRALFHSLVAIEREVTDILDVLGLMSSTYSELACPTEKVLQQLKGKALKRAEVTEDDILQKIEERTQARRDKRYDKSDQIRLELKAKGIALMDLGAETIWRPCVPAEQEQPIAPPST